MVAGFGLVSVMARFYGWRKGPQSVVDLFSKALFPRVGRDHSGISQPGLPQTEARHQAGSLHAGRRRRVNLLWAVVTSPGSTEKVIIPALLWV